MVFERKETPKEKPANTFWSILRWYWIIIPLGYLIVVLPEASEQATTGKLGMELLITTMYQLTNLGFAGILTVTPPIEQSRVGAADKVLKIAAIQQFLMQNILGFILTLIAWYKLPHKVAPEFLHFEDEKQNYFKPKTLYILAGVLTAITILTLIIQLQSING